MNFLKNQSVVILGNNIVYKSKILNNLIIMNYDDCKFNSVKGRGIDILILKDWNECPDRIKKELVDCMFPVVYSRKSGQVIFC